MKKNFFIGIVWVSLLSFMFMNFNLGLLLGIITGVIFRLFSGTIISYAIGITFGIMFV